MAGWDTYTLDVTALQNRDQSSLRLLVDACHAASRHAEYLHGGGSGHAEDVAQELVMWVLTTFLTQYEPGRTVYPLFLVVAKRSLLNKRRSVWREVSASRFGDDQEAVTHVLDAIAVEQGDGEPDTLEYLLHAEAATDKARAAIKARAALRARMTAVQNAPILNDAQRMTPITVTEKQSRGFDPAKRQRAQRPAVQKLISLRRNLGMTQRQFSELLNVAPGHINTLEQGTIYGEPEALLAVAEAAIRLSDRRVGITTAEIGELMQSWCRKLGLDDDDMAGLAMFIGVNRSTVHRWKKGDYVPKREQVEKIERHIEQLEAR